MSYTMIAEEVAEKTGVTADRVRQLARTGKIGKKVSVVWLFSKADVAMVLDRKGKSGKRFDSAE